VRRLPLTLSAALIVAALAVAPVPASQLSQVISKGNHLITLNRLRVTVDQVGRLLPLSAQLTTATKTWQSKRQDLLLQNRDQLAQARQAMIDDRPVSKNVEEALVALEESLQQNDDELYEAAVDVLADVRDELLPQQNAYIDWTPPRATATTTRETFVQRAARDREQRAMLLFAEQFLTRVRYYPLEQYILEAQRLVDDFLRPLVPVASPAYPQAQQFMFRLVEQVRLMGEPQWQAESLNYAAVLVQELGLDQPPDESVEERPYTWQDMYEIFSDPGTPGLFREIQEAASGAGG
jgi:hypothetical protein